jgi:hypothetical protein
MYMLDNSPLAMGQAFSHEGVNYPANWLYAATEEERTAIGITEVPDPVRPDDRFYIVTVNPDGTYSSEPTPMSDLQPYWHDQVNVTVNSHLASSDWMVTRFVETGVKVPDDWEAYRADTRKYGDQLKADIDAAADVDELQLVIDGQLWPLNPDEAASQVASTGGTKN